MAVLLPHSVFIHIPKTGGQWVRAALRRAGLLTAQLHCTWHPHGEMPAGHSCHHNRLQDIATDAFVFAFVRHPLSYYRSYWSYKMERGWDMKNTFDCAVLDDSFAGFIRKTLAFRETRGTLGEQFLSFVRTPERRADFVGTQEHLADDLVRALRMAGEQFDEAVIRSTPPVNVCGTLPVWNDQCVFPPSLRDAVLRQEQLCLEEFGYAGDYAMCVT